MESTRIKESLFRSFSDLVGDYLHSEVENPLFPPSYSSEELLKLAASREFSDSSRLVLYNALSEQYSRDGIRLNGIQQDELNQLKKKNTFTVVSGHQLCLLTGPLYFIIKILQTIKIADQLNKLQNSIHVVPVFWMASEDHDFDEINHVHLFGQTITWNDAQGGKVGAYKTESLGSFIDKIAELLGESENAKYLIDLFREAYLSRQNLAAATRKLVHELFSERPLLIIDGDDHNLKALFKDCIKKEISEQILFNKQQETIKSFKSSYKVQVNPREVNLFYLQPQKRTLIEKTGDTFRLKNEDKHWTLEEILNEIESVPENFSPNVVLRPVYQELILPNLCYVGGPGEVSYWLQLKSSFKAFNVSFPILSLRNSLMWLDKSKLKKLEKLALTEVDLFINEVDLNKKLADFEKSDEELDMNIAEVNRAFNAMAVKIQEVDPTLNPYVLSEGRKIEKQLEQLKSKLLRAKKVKNEERISAFSNLHEKVFPMGNLHERYDNFVPYFLKHHRTFFNLIYENIDPSDHRLIVIKEI